ncbi:hypothetical protein BVG16_11255 [Paenibacillus selenitireducens]|uniref:2-dehydropantoate 2-reductase n=1 Tax=Paenibacillus selenitireducens TaxID=1324314 RepID=A0A1T2XEX5_9BACL|nr:2-dehydropantoate 2-reductase [Paenibacillus selenitireducens]OPA78447.1 hypothetical protein BVG16_11255 [Paenibacillus selenitireducens]
MDIHIVGAGSLGLLFGSKLAQVGANVTIYTRTSSQAVELQDQGLSLITEMNLVTEKTSAVKIRVWDEIEDSYCIEENAWILLTMKQKDLTDAFARKLQHVLGETGRVCCFQNGVGHVQFLEQYLQPQQIYTAITTEAARRDEGAVVRHTGQGETRIGRMGGHAEASEHEIHLINWLQRAGFKAFMSKNIDMDVYRKLLINAVINPLTAIMRIKNGQLLETSERVQCMRWLYEETMFIYRAHNIPVEQNLWEQVNQVCRSTSANTSSMLKDILNGTESEIKWINGSLLRMADDLGIDAPVNRMVYTLVKAMHQSNT